MLQVIVHNHEGCVINSSLRRVSSTDHNWWNAILSRFICQNWVLVVIKVWHLVTAERLESSDEYFYCISTESESTWVNLHLSHWFNTVEANSALVSDLISIFLTVPSSATVLFLWDDRTFIFKWQLDNLFSELC